MPSEVTRDLAWLASLKENGHCGEGTMERQSREALNERIDRILALAQGTPSEVTREAIARIIDPDEWALQDSGRLPDGSFLPGWECFLNPSLAKADAIHHEIHKVCFIARSVNFPVDYAATYEEV